MNWPHLAQKREKRLVVEKARMSRLGAPTPLEKKESTSWWFDFASTWPSLLDETNRYCGCPNKLCIQSKSNIRPVVRGSTPSVQTKEPLTLWCLYTRRYMSRISLHEYTDFPHAPAVARVIAPIADGAGCGQSQPAKLATKLILRVRGRPLTI